MSAGATGAGAGAPNAAKELSAGAAGAGAGAPNAAKELSAGAAGAEAGAPNAAKELSAGAAGVKDASGGGCWLVNPDPKEPKSTGAEVEAAVPSPNAPAKSVPNPCVTCCVCCTTRVCAGAGTCADDCATCAVGCPSHLFRTNTSEMKAFVRWRSLPFGSGKSCGSQLASHVSSALPFP